MTIRTIEISLRSALRRADATTRTDAIASANRLYDEARDTVTDPDVRAEIDRLQAELQADTHQRTG